MQFKKCTSFFLASLLLVSNIGLAFNVHYCGGQIAEISSVFNTQKGCGMADDTKSCSDKTSITKKSCCEDKTVDLHDDSDEAIKSFSLEVASPFLIPELSQSVSMRSAAIYYSRDLGTYTYNSNAPPLYKLYNQYILYA